MSAPKATMATLGCTMVDERIFADGVGFSEDGSGESSVHWICETSGDEGMNATARSFYAFPGGMPGRTPLSGQGRNKESVTAKGTGVPTSCGVTLADAGHCPDACISQFGRPLQKNILKRARVPVVIGCPNSARGVAFPFMVE